MKTKTIIQKLLVFAIAFLTIRANSQNTFPPSGSTGIGTITPAKQLNVHQMPGSNKGILISGDEYYQTGNGDGNGVLLLAGVNRTGNRQLWIGDNTALGSATLGFFRYQTGLALPGIDAVTGNGVTRLPLGIGTSTSNVAVGFEYTGATGTTLPASRLSINGNATVGNAYIGTVAPSNGLLVQGNVGIGTITPYQKLQIGTNSGGPTPYPDAISLGNSYSNTPRQNAKLRLWDDNLGNVYGLGISENQLDFMIPAGSSRYVWSIGGSEKMRLQADGAVGIGTTNLGAMKLAVEGTIGARKIIVTQVNPFPDYVFKKDYKLRSLFDVEMYVNKYSRLPDVPSAKEVEKKGLDIGDTQTVLLKKIEELTRYVIDLNKEIDKIKSKTSSKK